MTPFTALHRVELESSVLHGDGRTCKYCKSPLNMRLSEVVAEHESDCPIEIVFMKLAGHTKYRRYLCT